MKKYLALILALTMLLALCACGGSKAEEPAPAAAEAPAAEAAPADGGAAAGDASGEPTEEPSGPIELFDMVINTPVIGEGAAAVFAVGGEYDKIVVDFVWTGPNGETITMDEGTFGEGDYTISVTFKAAEGYELTDPVSVKLVGGAAVDYQPVTSSGVDANGVPVYEMNNVVTLTAGDAQASGEASGEAS